MPDFVTQIANVSQLVTWYTSTVPSSIPSGDRYIAELAAGDYVLNGLTWSGAGAKTLVSAGQLIIRPQTGAYHNSAGAPARVRGNTVGPVLVTQAGIDSTFGCNVAGGFVFSDLQISKPNSGGFQWDTGTVVQRCAVTCSVAVGSALKFYNTCRFVNNLVVIPPSAWGPIFSGAGPVSSNTFVSFNGGTAISLQGTFMNAVWRNNYSLVVGSSVDAWPAPPSFYFQSSCSNNATSFATAGNMPGTAGQTNVPASTLIDTSSFAALDAEPVVGSVLRNTGVTDPLTEGVDWYQVTRPGTPAIGATEYQTAPSILDGGILLDDARPGGALSSSSSQISGGILLDDALPGGVLTVQPGTVVVPELRNWSGGLQAGVTVPIVTACRLTDGHQVLVLTSRVTDGAGNLSISSAALAVGTWYMVIGWNADGTQRFARPVLAT